MQATNDTINFFRGETLSSKMRFEEAIQKRPSNIDIRFEIPNEETLHKCEAMTAELKAKYPTMKPARIARKVAEFYHLSPGSRVIS